MQVTEPTAAPWRQPALAPVYGVVVAFAVVALASPFVGAREQLTVAVSAAAGTQLPAGLSVRIHHGAEQTPAELDGDSWSADVPAGDDQRVCVDAPTPMRLVGGVVGMEEACTAVIDGRMTPLTVEPVRVSAEVDGEQDAPPLTAFTVTVRDGGNVLVTGVLDEGGWFTPEVEDLPVDGEVCLTPPEGWTVDGAGPGERLACQAVGNLLSDIEFRVRLS